MKIDEFIVSLKNNETTFFNKPKVVTRYFMLTYDESLDLKGDFRYYIIAALHAKGAHHIKSYVASGIIFRAPATMNDSNLAIRRWKNYLNRLFNNGGTFGLMICMAKQYTNDNAPVFLKIPYGTIEEDFDGIRDEVIEKFLLL